MRIILAKITFGATSQTEVCMHLVMKDLICQMRNCAMMYIDA
jgi:hypothetical protein